MATVGARIQSLPLKQQTLALGRLVIARSGQRYFTGTEVKELFEDLALPAPKKISNVLAALRDEGLLRPGRDGWLVTPEGRQQSEGQVGGMDLRALVAEAAIAGARLGGTDHPIILPEFGAPPELVPGLHTFLRQHEFDLNVFGMTRFPPDEEPSDPVRLALDEAEDACRAHGLEFHLASHRQIVDGLWANVTAHMWACRYGIGIFEGLGDPPGRINYNLTIEVGGMLMAGRRCALLKDASIEKMPSDLTDKIYKSVELGSPASVRRALHRWIRDDLSLGPCPLCPS